MANAKKLSKLGALLVLLRAFRADRTPLRRVPAERYSRPAVAVTSDSGFAPIFPGMK